VTVLLDTHALLWSVAATDQLSPAAARAVTEADELAVASMTWWELAWLVRQGRVMPRGSLGGWLRDLARDVRTVALTPGIAVRAAELPRGFHNDPGDRLIYATAIEHGWPLVSKDARMRAFDREGTVVVW
jgi:PIN domain nuclease of toxin-antitoxin system